MTKWQVLPLEVHSGCDGEPKIDKSACHYHLLSVAADNFLQSCKQFSCSVLFELLFKCAKYSPSMQQLLYMLFFYQIRKIDTQQVSICLSIQNPRSLSVLISLDSDSFLMLASLNVENFKIVKVICYLSFVSFALNALDHFPPNIYAVDLMSNFI